MLQAEGSDSLLAATVFMRRGTQCTNRRQLPRLDFQPAATHRAGQAAAIQCLRVI